MSVAGQRWAMAAALTLALPVAAAAAIPEPVTVPGRLLVRFAEEAAPDLAPRRSAPRLVTPDADLERLQREAGVRDVRRALPDPARPDLAGPLGLSRWYVLDVDPARDPRELARQWRQHPSVEWAQPEHVATLDAVPDDPLFPDQWGHANTAQMLDFCIPCDDHAGGSPVGTPGFDADVEGAWSVLGSRGDSAVVIAVIDTGIDLDHPDLAYVAGWDFKDDDPMPEDEIGHGSMVAGIIGALADNGIGPAGVSPGCTILPIRTGNSTTARTNGLLYGVDNGAWIVNMSWTFYLTNKDSLFESAVEYAGQVGALMVSSSGNRNEPYMFLPQKHPAVMAIGGASPCGGRKRSSSDPAEAEGSTDEDPNGVTCDNEVWWGSCYGTDTPDSSNAVDLLAPIILPTTYKNESYEGWFSGTSCAAPFVSGVAALVWSMHPAWTADQVWQALTATATDVVNVESGPGWDRYSGHGLVNAAAAVAWDPTSAPEPAPSAGPGALRIAGRNPFREAVRIDWSVAASREASLSVHDATGRRVRELVRTSEHGTRTTTWDGRDDRGAHVADGVYFVTLRAGDAVRARKVVLRR